MIIRTLSDAPQGNERVAMGSKNLPCILEPLCLSSRHGSPSPPTKSLGFRGFDSSRLLILGGGNSHIR